MESLTWTNSIAGVDAAEVVVVVVVGATAVDGRTPKVNFIKLFYSCK